MPDRPLDVLAIGNAIVDVIADADDDFLAREGMAKGAMRLIDQAEAVRLYEAMGPGREASGGSAANTVAGLASLGLNAAFVGQLGLDQLGEIFTHDIRSLGVRFDTAASVEVGATARCLILVTPDAQRTMNTFLGAAQMLGPNAVDAEQVAAAKILYLEGYLWDPEAPRRAMMKAMEAARAADTKVAFSLSDSFVVDRHRRELWQLLEDKRVDILFANEAEIMSLALHESADEAGLAVAAHVPTVVVTCSAQGAFALSDGEKTSVSAEPIERLVDTTGAGDLFAAGFLAGQARSLGIEASLKLGAICAAEVIQHYGARPEAELKQLASQEMA
ncbi:MAG TPA: adenosine kinase [Sphingomicrobium sp.]|nr:adenosine kinase [Sphingomicrobium sp.]